MPLNQALENTGEILRPGPAGGSGPASRRRRKEMTTFDDLFGTAFRKFRANSID